MFHAKGRRAGMATDSEAAIAAEGDEEEVSGLRIVAIGPQDAGGRVDKVLAHLLPEMSRARLQALIAQGRVRPQRRTRLGRVRKKAQAGDYRIEIPPFRWRPSHMPVEAIPLSVLFEDADLIVVDKPAGMAVHPAPGSESGTLVNALLPPCWR